MSILMVKNLDFFDTDVSQVRKVRGGFSPIQPVTFGSFDFGNDFSADFKLDTTSGAAGFATAFGVGIGGQPIIDIGTGTV